MDNPNDWCSPSKLQFMPAVDGRGYPIKDSCILEDIGLVAVFEGLTNPQPGKTMIMPVVSGCICEAMVV